MWRHSQAAATEYWTAMAAAVAAAMAAAVAWLVVVVATGSVAEEREQANPDPLPVVGETATGEEHANARRSLCNHFRMRKRHTQSQGRRHRSRHPMRSGSCQCTRRVETAAPTWAAAEMATEGAACLYRERRGSRNRHTTTDARYRCTTVGTRTAQPAVAPLVALEAMDRVVVEEAAAVTAAAQAAWEGTSIGNSQCNASTCTTPDWWNGQRNYTTTRTLARAAVKTVAMEEEVEEERALETARI